MVYAKAFVDLQVDFARAVSVLSGLSCGRALLDYTNLYIRFGLGRQFDPAHPTWREYLAGLEEADDAREWTYRFYLARHADGLPPVDGTFGCFAYARLGTGRIRMHFQNAETDGHSPLALHRRDQRMAELSALFAHVRRTIREPVVVVGTSWLYNLDAYRRLFPPSYVGTAHVIPGRFRHMPLWGQFLDRHGGVKEAMAHAFLERVARQSSVDGLEQCFPLPALGVEAPVLDFYAFYGV